MKNRILVPHHARKRLIAINKEEALKLQEDVLNQLEEKNIFYNNPKDFERVAFIAKRIVDVLPEPIDINIKLANTEAINAFSMIGGAMVVTKGALEYFPDNELAFIIAHEYGHTLARHSQETLTKGIINSQIYEKVINPLLNNNKKNDGQENESIVKKGYAFIAELGVLLPYDRTMENEADALGIVYMKKAGFDVDGALKAMQLLLQIDSEDKNSIIDEWLSTHPLSSKRLQRLRAYANFESGKLLDDVLVDDSELPLDWAYGAIKMIDELNWIEQKCENAKGDIIFIPGILNNLTNDLLHLQCNNVIVDYKSLITSVYPDFNVTVLEWEALSKLSWKRAIYRSEFLAKYLSKILKEKREDELKNLTLIGHSLGTNVVMQIASDLDKSGIKVKQIILLGAAVHYDSPILQSCENISLDNPIILFHSKDKILKYAYYFEEHVPALGLLGAKSTLSRFKEYRIPIIKNDNIAQDQQVSLVNNFNNVFSSHSVNMYFDHLKLVYQKKLLPETVKIDHLSIASPIKLPVVIPSTGGRILDEYHDWDIVAYKRPQMLKKQNDGESVPDENKTAKMFYVIRNPYGQYCGWALREATIKNKFAEIKGKIDSQLKQSNDH